MKNNEHTIELDSKIQAGISYSYGDIFIDKEEENELYMICIVSNEGCNLISLKDGVCWSGKVFHTLKDMAEEIVSQGCFVKVDSGSILKITVS